MSSPVAAIYSISDDRQIITTIASFLSNAKMRIDGCISSYVPIMTGNDESITKARIDAMNRGVKIRYIIDITNENLEVCKKLLPLVSEVRHLDSIKDSFGVSDSELIAANITGFGAQSDQFIHSNSRTVVELHQHLFELLWEKAVQADQRIKELEERVPIQKTELIAFGQDSLARNNEVYERTQKTWDVCADQKTLIFVLGFRPLYNAFLDLKKRRVRIRFITEVTIDSLVYCKELIKIVDELRHVDNVKGNFGISDGREYLAVPTTEITRSSTTAPHLIYSNVGSFVEQHLYFFETLWNNAIPAEKRIREIETESEREFLNVMTDKEKIKQAYIEAAMSIEEDAFLLLSNSKSLEREYNLGVIDIMINVSVERDAKIKIICPLDKGNSHIREAILKRAPNIMILNGEDSASTLFVVDHKRYFRAEIPNPEAETFEESIGYVVYSNSKPSVDSFRSLLQQQWNSYKLIEKLKAEDTIKDDFINVAAHELRTPIHPIMMYAGLLLDSDIDPKKAAEAILAQSNKFNELAEDILTAARIENNSLSFAKERLDLHKFLSDYIANIKLQTRSESVKITYELQKSDGDLHYSIYNNDSGEDNSSDEVAAAVMVYADKVKITRVVANLLSNAQRFTSKGTIRVILGTIISGKSGDRQEAIVSVEDSGIGIDADVYPRLFTKYASKSQGGLGLGLFISKNIIEGHDGKMWAENNRSGVGATFYFTIPIDIKNS